MVKLAKTEQPEKDELPIVVTLEGMITLVKLEHFWNALEPMVINPSSMFTFFRK